MVQGYEEDKNLKRHQAEFEKSMELPKENNKLISLLVSPSNAFHVEDKSKKNIITYADKIHPDSVNRPKAQQE